MKEEIKDDLTYKIIGCAIKVHNILGNGFPSAAMRLRRSRLRRRSKASVSAEANLRRCCRRRGKKLFISEPWQLN
jgi:hypothetical protein